MKKRLLLIVLAMTAMVTGVNADVEVNAENFPDTRFRSWLLRQWYGKDGVISEEEIADVKEINVGGLFFEIGRSGSVSLKGIEYFTELTTLKCYSYLVNLSSDYIMSNDVYFLYNLDVSKNTKLTYLDCRGNMLSKLDLSKNTALEHLDCSNNSFTTLDLSKNTALKELRCYKNSIRDEGMDALVASLPQSTGGDPESATGEARRLYIYYNETENENTDSNKMTEAQVAAAKARGWDPYWYDDKWEPYMGCDVEIVAEINEENFPDENFRNYLLSQTYGADGVLTAFEISRLTELYVGGKEIASLKGIEFFTAVERIDCSSNSLTTVDVSQNKKLFRFFIDRNNINGAGMDKLIASLPTRGGTLFAVNFYKTDNEHNVITKSQVAKALERNWTVRAWSYDEFMEDVNAWPYEGSDDPDPGDVNCDNVTDVADIASIINVMATSVEGDLQYKTADVNKDGAVDVADIVTVINIMATKARRMNTEE